MPLNKKEISTNLSYAAIGQLTALVMSVVVNLFVSKVLQVDGFGYWQLFIFYVGFGGFLPFGLYDGLYLKLGGKHYEKLNKSIVGTLFHMSLLWQLLLIAIGTAATLIFADGERKIVLLASWLYVLAYNVSAFASLLLQAVNRVKSSSISIIIFRVLFMVALIPLLIIRFENVNLYILFYIIAQVISMGYCLYECRHVFFAKLYKFHKFIGLYWGYCKIGIVLTLANLASLLIVGVCRFFIDSHWGIMAFSITSFALTLTHFVLIFVNQVGLVFFPALRRCTHDEIIKFYRKYRRKMIVFLPLSLFFIYPISLFIEAWLPKYSASIPYFFILAPLCLYDGRMQTLGYTLLKVYRKEKIMLLINSVAVCVTILLSVIAAYVFDSLMLIVVVMLLSIIARTWITEIYFAKMFNLPYKGSLSAEVAISAAFIMCNILLPWHFGSIIFAAAYIVYFFFNKKIIAY